MIPTKTYQKRLPVLIRDKMVREHVEQGASIGELAERYGVSQMYVQRSLIHAGSYRLLGDKDVTQIRERYARGDTHREIQAAMKISARRMQQIVRELKLPHRHPGRVREVFPEVLRDEHGNQMTELTCRTCEQTKPLDAFYYRETPGGEIVPIQPCILCRRQYPSQRKGD